MPITTESVTTYECDQCGKTAEGPNTAGGAPMGWLNMYPSLWFCKWKCVKNFAVAQMDEMENPVE